MGEKDYHSSTTKVAYKIKGYDFVVEYKCGSENKVANALSRRHLYQAG